MKTMLLTGLAAAMLVPAASASAADRFVDSDLGDDTGANTCTSQASPCQTIGYALTQAASGDALRVDDDAQPYSGTTLLSSSISLLGAEFIGGDEGDVVIDGGSSFALRIQPGETAGTIGGLTLRSTATAVLSQGTIEAVTDNTFDSGGADQVDIDIRAGTPLISQNLFTDADTSVFDRAVLVDGSSPTISDNDFQNQSTAIQVGQTTAAPAVRVEDNTITGTHGSNVGNGFGIFVNRSVGMVVEDNLISAPDSVSATSGMSLSAIGLTDTTSVTLRRNQVYGQDTGIFLGDTSNTTMNGDVIGGSTQVGLLQLDDVNPTGSSAVTGKNVTIVGDAAVANTEVQPIDTALTLDSSIIGDDGIDPIGTGSCAISRSRGPVTGTGCDNFQTTAAPEFVNPAANDYRLTSSAANLANLIDLGDPAGPSGLDTVDFDGQKRAIDGNGDCTERRDIGADEFLPAPPTAAITSGPANGSTINASAASFSFTNSNTCPGASFQCSLDGAAFGACSSPAILSGLGNGSHTFAVRALDLVPQSGAAATRTFTVSVPSPPTSQPPAAIPPPAAIQPAAKKKCKKAKKRAVAAKKCKKKKK